MSHTTTENPIAEALDRLRPLYTVAPAVAEAASDLAEAITLPPTRAAARKRIVRRFLSLSRAIASAGDSVLAKLAEMEDFKYTDEDQWLIDQLREAFRNGLGRLRAALVEHLAPHVGGSGTALRLLRPPRLNSFLASTGDERIRSDGGR